MHTEWDSVTYPLPMLSCPVLYLFFFTCRHIDTLAMLSITHLTCVALRLRGVVCGIPSWESRWNLRVNDWWVDPPLPARVKRWETTAPPSEQRERPLVSLRGWQSPHQCMHVGDAWWYDGRPNVFCEGPTRGEKRSINCARPNVSRQARPSLCVSRSWGLFSQTSHAFRVFKMSWSLAFKLQLYSPFPWKCSYCPLFYAIL